MFLDQYIFNKMYKLFTDPLQLNPVISCTNPKTTTRKNTSQGKTKSRLENWRYSLLPGLQKEENDNYSNSVSY